MYIFTKVHRTRFRMGLLLKKIIKNHTEREPLSIRPAASPFASKDYVFKRVSKKGAEKETKKTSQSLNMKYNSLKLFEFSQKYRPNQLSNY